MSNAFYRLNNISLNKSSPNSFKTLSVNKDKRRFVEESPQKPDRQLYKMSSFDRNVFV